jgi:hypothetical protein
MTALKLIGVIGSGDCDDETSALAYAVGKGIAEAGFALVCGGLGGVMESACKGAVAAGGLTVGILPGESPEHANPYVKVRIATGMGIARNTIIVRTACSIIALSGGAGTLSEMAFAVKSGTPVVSLKSFAPFPEIVKVESPAEAVAKAIALAQLS